MLPRPISRSISYLPSLLTIMMRVPGYPDAMPESVPGVPGHRGPASTPVHDAAAKTSVTDRAAGGLRYTRRMESGSRSTRALTVTGLAVLALAAFCAGVYFAGHGRAPDTPDIPGFLWPDPVIVEDFSLDDAKGGAFDASRLDGRWTLL